MAIAPLQIPGYAQPQTVDWSPLNQLGTILEDNQKRQTLADLGKGLADGSLDYRTAAGKVAGTGNLTGTLSLLQLAEAKDKLARETAASNAFTQSLGGLFGGNIAPQPAPRQYGPTVPNDSNAMPGTIGMDQRLADLTSDFLQDNPGTSISSGFRSNADQQRLYDSRGSNPNPVALPGTSNHERGMAVDIAGMTPDQRAMLPQYGLAQPVANDPPHVELAASERQQQPYRVASADNASLPGNAHATPPAAAPQAGPQIGAAQIPTLLRAMASPNLPAPQRELAGKLLSSALDASKMPDTMKMYIYARSQGYRGTALEYQKELKRSGATIVDTGTIPAGYRANRDTDGRVISIEPLPGSPAAQEAKAASDKQAAASSQKNRYADVVTTDIDRAIKKIDDTGWIDLPVTGYLGERISKVGGTDAHDLASLLTTVRANIGFDRLQALRDASPTGGALGQVSDFENRQLQSTLGNLEQSQTAAQLKDNLNRVYNTYLDIIHGPGNGPERRQVGGGRPQQTNSQPAPRPSAPRQPPAVGTVQDNYRFKGGNPADPNSWEPFL